VLSLSSQENEWKRVNERGKERERRDEMVVKNEEETERCKGNKPFCPLSSLCFGFVLFCMDLMLRQRCGFYGRSRN